MKRSGRVEERLHSCLTSELYDEKSDLRGLGRCPPPLTEHKVAWNLDTVSEKRQASGYCKESSPGSSVARSIRLSTVL
jgi:hypothetical protein